MGKAEKNLPINQQPQGTDNVTPISTVPGKQDDFALVVFGRDEGGRPHASRFGAAEAELAIKAAGLMGFRVLPIARDEQRAAASAVAQGRIFGSGKAFAPFCRDAAYAALEAFPEAYAPPMPVEPEPEPLPAAIGTPGRWEDIAVGSLVLASADADSGWWPALVTEDRGEQLFVLRWKDWEGEASFVRRLDGLALLPSLTPAGA